MVGVKHRSRYRKKTRGFKGIPSYVRREVDNEMRRETGESSSSITVCSLDASPRGEDVSTEATCSASRRKLADRGFEDDLDVSSDNSGNEDSAEYRLFDVNLLSSAFSSIHTCVNGEIIDLKSN